MVHDDDTGSHPDFDIYNADRPAEPTAPRWIPDHILAEIHEKALLPGWDAERIHAHLLRFLNIDVPVKTIRRLVKQVRRNQ